MLSAALKSWLTTGLLLAAILAGSLLGGLAPRLADRVADFADPLILLLVGTLFFTLRLDGFSVLRRAPRTVLLAVFVFFVLTYLLREGMARGFRLSYPAHAVLTMTTSARNAPLMLALTTITLPEQPLIHAAIILGMLIEFPHLTVITQLLRRQHTRHTLASEYAMAS